MKNRTVMTAIGVIALVLVVALMSGLVGFLVRDRHPELIGKGSEAAETSFIVTPEEKSGIMALSTMRAAAVTSSGEPSEGSYTLTATVSPGNATNKKVDWTVSWVNAGDSWAKGKQAEEYVTVSPSSDGSVQATVTCLAPFGAQIKVTCTSRSAPSVHAECLCDYVKRVESVVLRFYALSDTVNLYDGVSYPLQEVSVGTTSCKVSEVLYTAYTVENTLTLDHAACYMNFTDEFLTSFSQYSGLSSTQRAECAKLNTDGRYYLGETFYFDNAGEGGAFYFIAEQCGANSSLFMDSRGNHVILPWAKQNPTIFPFAVHLLFDGDRKDCEYVFKIRPDPDNIDTL